MGRGPVLAVASVIVALALLGSARVGAFQHSAASAALKPCPALSVAAVIGGKRACLKVGQRCKKRLDRAYHRYGFHCHSRRLTRAPMVARGSFVMVAEGTQPNIGHLYTVRGDGKRLKKLTSFSGRHFESDPQWSPDSSKVAFTRYFDCAPLGFPSICFAVLTINADGSGERRLRPLGDEDKPLVSCDDPTWSPDGRRIAYVETTEVVPEGFEGELPSDLFVMNADGSESKRLTSLGHAEDPAWSPDGKQIAFTHRTPGSTQGGPFGGDIYVLDLEENTVRRLTDTPQLEFAPDWSPDGRHITYERSDAHDDSEIYVMNADGTASRNVSHNPTGGDDVEPIWSPNGDQIAFLSARISPGLFYDSAQTLYLVGADGKQEPRRTPITVEPNQYAFDWGTPPG